MLSEPTRDYAGQSDFGVIRRPWGLNGTAERLALSAALGLGLLILLSGVVLAYGRQQGGTFYRGVSVAGVDLGGLSQDEAQRRLDARVTAAAPTAVTLVDGDHRWSVSLQDLGASYDVASSISNAHAVGRSGNVLVDSRAWLQALVHGYRTPLVVKLDGKSTYAQLQQVAITAAMAPEDARYTFDSSGRLTIDPGKPGVGIDVNQTEGAVQQRLAELSAEPVTVALVTVTPAVTQAALEPGLKQAAAITSAPLVLTSAHGTWELDPAALRALVSVGTVSGTTAVGLQTAGLQASIGALAPQVDAPGQNPTVKWQGNAFSVVPGVPGQTLDVPGSVQAVSAALEAGQHQVALKTSATPPKISQADAQAAADNAAALVSQPLTVTWSGGSTSLAPADLAGVVRFSEQPGQTPAIVVSIDDAAVGQLIQSLAKKVETPAVNASLRYLNGAVTVVSAEKQGTTLDAAQSATAIRTALLGGQHTAAIVTKTVQAQVTAAMASSIAIRDRLSTSNTSYVGSIPNRKWNVELAVKTVNGALIPPGGTFSFTGTTGPVDTAHGYKLGYGIEATGGPGGVTTVPSVGGGICQVSTTLFQTAFWAGMPIVERYWHLYWIPSYGNPPAGMKGLDATVDTDAGLDFKFKNPTSDWLAIVATADGSTVHFELWGTKQNWQIKVDGPVVTNVVKADTTMQRQTSNSMAPGSSLLVEHAEDGFDVSIHRQVIANGKVIDDLNLKSHYVPSANITLVGPQQ
ncbi:MAG TPA: peptidoglycan binding domain-containing protein [Thermomicrobiaceae bacterium]|nr:peptidoglycan binding domain-containing protein [Thermomicrobiaceae bacterium]